MKENHGKWLKKRPLHYVMRASKFLREKYPSFLKMDKKNVQNRNTQILYGKSLDCEHILKLR